MSNRSPFGKVMCIRYGSIARHTAFIRRWFMLKMSSTICSSSTPRLRSSATSAATFSGERQRNFLPKMSWQYVHWYGQPREVKIGA